jgi:lathosterol oxidase
VAPDQDHEDAGRPPLDLWFERTFGDDAPSHLGTGWASGTASVFLGASSLLAVVVFHFPAWLSTERFRALYPVDVLRTALLAAIVLAFGLGVLSLLLRRRKTLGLTGGGLALLATLLGGSGVPLDSRMDRPVTLGLDWFLLNLLLLALLFVPLEQLFPHWPEQGPFRVGWTTDTLHFLGSHVFVQALSFLILLPATTLAGLWRPEGQRGFVRAQPVWLQFLECVLVADLAQYAVHRSFHKVKWLWRFHAIHHSSTALDWLAGSRLHVVDVLATRSLVLLPLFLAGFAEPALQAYLVFVSFHAVFIHANVRFRFGRLLESLLVTPRFHHWHHAAAPEARDKNFAVHLPGLDRLFGSAWMPAHDRWPEEYGAPADPVPPGYLGQLVYPFRSAPGSTS